MSHLRSFTCVVRLCVLSGTIVILANCGGGSTSGTTPATSGAPLAGGLTRSLPRHVASSIHDGLRSTSLGGWAAAQRAADVGRAHRQKPSKPVPASQPGPAFRVRAISTADRGQTRAAALGSATALVLYDNTGPFAFLGELYGMAIANLAGHFGNVTTEPIGSYTSGQMGQYSAAIYVGSTYYADATGIPAAFYSDVAGAATPVIWIGDNIWYMADEMGTLNFDTEYGWDPTNSFFAPNGSVGDVTNVVYNGQTLTRSVPTADDGGVLHPLILGGGYPAVTTLATAVDTSTSPSTMFPWALRSGNLTYVGEIPFSFVNETDRVIAFEDMLFDALAPATTPRHRAMVRLEDLNATDNASQLLSIAQKLYNMHIPYGFNVIPLYKDPLGAYNNGVPRTIPLFAAFSFDAVLRYMTTHGGTMIDEGWTHQYSNVKNPYTGASGDDAEFFRVHVDGTTNNVIWDGPVAEDSTAWTLNRVRSAAAAFQTVGFPKPSLWVTPHYFATDIDYRAIATVYPERYERSIYFNGVISGQPVNHLSYIGQFFPYVVQDVYGTKVVPENLGDYEPVSLNNNPIRLPANIINEAQLNLAVRDGFASFFYDPTYGWAPLQQTINGIQALGYTFVSPSSL